MLPAIIAPTRDEPTRKRYVEPPLKRDEWIRLGLIAVGFFATVAACIALAAWDARQTERMAQRATPTAAAPCACEHAR